MRYGWCMTLRPGMGEEYRRRHDEIWPEMSALLTEAGYRDYAIFRHGDLIFGTFATDDLAGLQACIQQSPVAARWRAHMAEVIDNNAGRGPSLLPLQFYHP